MIELLIHVIRVLVGSYCGGWPFVRVKYNILVVD